MKNQLTYHEVTRGLEGNPHTGMFKCPAHDDQNPSLHVSVGASGKVLFRCHAGCSQQDVLDALGFTHHESNTTARKQTTNDLSEDERIQDAFRIFRAVEKPYDRSRSSLANYLRARGIEWVPENAMLLGPETDIYLANRDGSKSRQWLDRKNFHYPAMVLPLTTGEHLTGAQLTFLTDNYLFNVKTKEGKSWRLTYGKQTGSYIQLSEPQPDRPLLIAESIEDALSAAQLTGLPAISAISANNLAKINPPPCSEIIICGDKDDTGRACAQAAAAAMARPGRPVRIAIPPDHKDWNEALRDRNADHKELADMIVNAPEFTKPAKVTALGMGEFLALQFPPRHYLLKPWLTSNSLLMIDGLPGALKTRLALSIAYAVASGQRLDLWPCEHKARVLYVDGELPGELLQQWLRELGPELPASDFKVLSHSQFAARGQTMFDLATEAGQKELDAEIEKYASELIMLDSISTLVRSGDDNDVASWRAVQDWSLKHRARGRTGVYLHHHGRSGQPRGTSMREIVLDARIKVTHDKSLSTDIETAIKLEFPKSRAFFGADSAPRLMYMSTASGAAVWRSETIEASNREKVKELLDQGWTQADIAKDIDLTQARVSQLVKQIKTEESTDS
jgi:putative DNA primase/helicase